MRCRDFQERISAAVDNYLAAEDVERFSHHADICPPCRREFEQEAATKRLLHARAHMLPVPPSLQEKICSQIERETAQTRHVFALPHSRLQFPPFVHAAAAFAVAAVLVALLVRGDRGGSAVPPTSLDAALASEDMIALSVHTFHTVLSGEIHPDVLSSEPRDVEAFFAGKTEFPVHLPLVREWTLVGGVLNEHNGRRLVHVMYDNGGASVYLSQSRWDTLQVNGYSLLAPAAMAEMQRTGWFARQGDNGIAVVAWRAGHTLCVAVARMECDRLTQCLQEARELPVP